jgi:hypothetical protein
VRELGKYKLDSVSVQEVRWEKGDTEWAKDYILFHGEGNGNHQLGTSFFVHKRIISVVWKLEFIRDRMLHIILEVAGAKLLF